MKNTKKFYTEDEYIDRNPELHSEDSEWKISKILPLIDILMKDFDKHKKKFTILDIGGGKGLILHEVSDYLKSKYKVYVEKEVIDLSPGMLNEQKKTNPDIVKTLNESIVHTSLKDKSIDLCLMIDVLEHIPHPEKALIELKRISNYVIFKVPLEDTLIINTINALFNNYHRKKVKEKLGHINPYNAELLLKQLEEYCGEVIHHEYTDVYGYYLFGGKQTTLPKKVFYTLGYGVNSLSPDLAGKIFNDFLMVLVKCK